MEKEQETYLAWLRDAHAMEEGLITVLEKQVEETGVYPDMQARIEEHLDQTRRHAAMIAACIERNGGDTSGVKDFMSRMSATVSGFGMSMMDDQMVKNLHSSYATEHFEIATYTVLRAAAETCGDFETASICEDILDDEIEMANWLIDQLPKAVEMHLSGTPVEA